MQRVAEIKIKSISEAFFNLIASSSGITLEQIKDQFPSLSPDEIKQVLQDLMENQKIKTGKEWANQGWWIFYYPK